MDNFKNDVLSIESLVSLSSTDFNRLHADYKYLRMTRLSLLWLMLTGVGVLIVLNSDLSFWIFSLSSFLILTIALIYVQIGFPRYGYALREKDISFKSGLIFFKQTSVPFSRIQHCEYSQGPLSKLFDLAEVKVFTAGGSSSDITISGLYKEEAQNLREEVIRLSNLNE